MLPKTFARKQFPLALHADEARDQMYRYNSLDRQVQLAKFHVVDGHHLKALAVAQYLPEGAAQ
jgi:hypothetical protein